MPSKRFIGAAAFSAALAAGGLAGAMFGTPVLSGAQEGTETQTETAPPGPGGPGARHKGEDHLATAAGVLGMSADELRTELQSGKSIAEVATAKGVDKQKVIDALVAAATARMDQMKAELPNRMAEMVDRQGFLRGPGGAGGPGRGGHRHGGAPMAINAVDDAATALGMPVQELRDALASGKSIADVAAEKNVAIDKVISAMVADATERIDRAVADGRITQEQATERKATLNEKITELVNRDGPLGDGHHRGHGGRHGPGGGPGPMAPNAGAEPEAQNSSTTA